MRKEYDFSHGKRGALISEPGKERITIRLDADILAWFRAQVSGGGNYQTLINDALRAHIGDKEGALERTLRRVIREELHAD
ncbi:MAG: BrnA antitoxin family protein [Rhodanobacteraceae bacterium]